MTHEQLCKTEETIVQPYLPEASTKVIKIHFNFVTILFVLN